MKHRILSIIAILLTLCTKAQFTVDAGHDAYLCGSGDTATQLHVYLLNHSGGVFSYKWSPSTGLNDSTLNYPIASPLTTTTYIVTVTNTFDGDTAIDSVTVYVSEGGIQVQLTATNVSCNDDNDGNIISQVSGGTAPYTYIWFYSNFENSFYSTDSDQVSVKAGPYSLFVYDANNCYSYTHSATVTEPTAISLSHTKTDATCNGSADGSITISATGGTPPYTYGLNGGPLVSNPVFSNLQPGDYMLNVFDANGCTSDTTIIVTITGTPLNVNFNNLILPSSCSSLDGSVCATVTGGSGPYVYSWSNGAISSCIAGLMNTNYRITVSDILGCTGSATVNVINTSNSQIVIDSIGGNNVSCHSLNDGTLQVSATGNNPPFNYVWNTANVTDVVTNLQAGTYTVTVTDAVNCINVKSFHISQPAALTLQPNIINVDCHGNSTGAIDMTVLGGTFPYTYQWSTNETTEDIVNLPAGTYNVTITDNSGCSVVGTYTITEPTVLVSTPTVTPATCGLFNGKIIMTSTGGIAPYNYSWNSGQITPVIISGVGFNSSVTVTDANHCSVSMTVPVSNIQSPNLEVTVEDATCGFTGKACAIATGGAGPYGYTWQTGVALPCMYNVAQGTYGLTVSDANGCSATTTVTIANTDTCVWPGDADYSGMADNNDLLAIGLGYGTTGTTRADQSIDWYAHQSTNWTDYLGDTTNYKHIDCNGDGVINADDTLAIIQNYSLTHPRNGPDEVRGGIPAMRVRMVPDTLIDGQTMVAHLDLGDANSTVSNVYGLAFTFNFDVLVVDTNEVSITFSNSSWLCDNATDHIDIDKKDLAAGKIHTALTRIDHTTRSGGGEIGRVTMKITTGNINGKELEYYAMNCYVNNLRVIDNNGNVMDVDAIGDAATIEYEPVGINEISWQGEVSLYPNPAQQQLTVSSSKLPIGNLQVTNLLGKVVMQQQNLNTAKASLNINTLSEGVYILKLSSGNQTYHTKFMVAK